MPLLEVEDLSVGFHTERGLARVVDGLSFTVDAGRIVGLVGESGCGKSITARAIMRLLQSPPAVIEGRRIALDGENLLALGERAMRDVRGNRIGMIFQEPMTSLNPTFPVGFQIGETLRLHRNMGGAAIRVRVLELLHMVGIGAPERRFAQYPHELSGGLRQRVMIAMALACHPALLIADEPTTALDVTIQAQILELLVRLRDELGMAILLITHDLGVVAEYADEVIVMYAGKLAEWGDVRRLFRQPRHPYTKGLLGSMPRLAGTSGPLPPLPAPCRARSSGRPAARLPAAARARPSAAARLFRRSPGTAATASPAGTLSRDPLAMSSRTDPILEVQDLVKHFPVKGGRIHAVNGVSFRQARGETIGIVGESGCGKSTLARTVLRLIEPTSGQLLFDGEDLLRLPPRTLRRRRRDMQIVFQDPYASLDPRVRIGASIEEPLAIHRFGGRAERARRVAELLELVGLGAEAASRYPHEFSGGQRQRIGIARAIAAGPKLVIADEPVSALDVSIQSQILNLLVELRDRLALSLLFISHDLAVIRYISERVAVMYLGQLVEMGEAASIYEEPAHPYTQALLSAIPQPDPDRRRKRIVLAGDVPSPEHPPAGCPFHPRCPQAMDRCRTEVPLERNLGTEGHPRLVRCHLY
jgi:peptide/nickel transport system ATP-binding protein